MPLRFGRDVGGFSVTCFSRETGCIYLQAEWLLQAVGLLCGGNSCREAILLFLIKADFLTVKSLKNCLFFFSLTPKGLSPAMSPALQRLVNRTASKYTDKALRASYTPSPAHTGTPGYKTPASGPQTPQSTPQSRTVSQTPVSQDTTSITDNLLQLPKRRKASDFFWTFYSPPRW